MHEKKDKSFGGIETKYVKELAALSAARTASDERFSRHVDNVKGMREISDREEVSLEYEARKAQMKSDRELRELDEASGEDGEAGDKKNEKNDEKKGRRKRNAPRDDDVVLEEAFKVLSDLIRLTDGEEMPLRNISIWSW